LLCSFSQSNSRTALRRTSDPADAAYLTKSMTAQNPQELAAFLESLEDYVPTVALCNMQLLLRPRKGVFRSHSHVLSVS